MKIYNGWKFNNESEALKCPLCSSTFLESSSNIEVQEWQQGQTEVDKPKLNTVYTCSACGHRFSVKDIEEKKTFKKGMSTMFVIFLMIVLLLVVLL